MKYPTIVTLLLSLSCSVSAQNNYIDSLLQQLPTAQPGYDRVDYLLGIARIYMTNYDLEGMQDYMKQARQETEQHPDPTSESALLVFEAMFEKASAKNMTAVHDKTVAALALARASGNQDAITFARYQYAEMFSKVKGDYERAKTILLDCIAEFDETVTLKNKSSTYKNLGIAYARTGADQRAIECFNQALRLLDTVYAAPDSHFLLGRISALYADRGVSNRIQTAVRLAEVYTRLGRLTKAEALLQQHLDLAEAHQNEDYIAWVGAELGQLCFKMGDYQRGIALIKRAIEIWERLGVIPDVMHYQVVLGDAFLLLKEYDNALHYYQKSSLYRQNNLDTLSFLRIRQKEITALLRQGNLTESQQLTQSALSLAQSVNNQQSKMEVFRTAGQVAFATGDFAQANEYLREVLAFSRAKKERNLETEVLTELANYHFKQNKLAEAEQLAMEGLAVAEAADRQEYLNRNYQLLAQIAEERKDYKSALRYLRANQQQQTNLLAADAQTILRAEQVRQNVNTYKSEKEAADLRAELLATQNQFFLGFAAALLMILVIGGYLFFQLRKAKSQLEHQNQQLDRLNQTKDKFFSIIAHDIRSPVVALESVGEQVDYYLNTNKTEKLQHLAHRIGTTAQRLSALLDNLLHWALVQQSLLPHHPVKIEVREAMEQTIAMFQMNVAAKNIKISNHVARTLSVRADPASFHTILRNLLSNAIKFTPVGGRVEVTAKTINENVNIQIKDSGIGMTQQVVEEVFALNPHSQRGTTGERGTGLGLILCKELVELNGGTIEVKSTVGVGSTFEFSLPVTTAVAL